MHLLRFYLGKAMLQILQLSFLSHGTELNRTVAGRINYEPIRIDTHSKHVLSSWHTAAEHQLWVWGMWAHCEILEWLSSTANCFDLYVTVLFRPFESGGKVALGMLIETLGHI